MATWKQVQDALIDWVESVTGVGTGMLAYTNAPEPATFALVTLHSNVKKGTSDEEIRTDRTTDTLVEIIPRRELHATIQVFTPYTADDGTGTNRTAFDLLSQLRDSASLPSNTDRFASVSLALQDASEVLYIPDVPGEQWRSRATLDVIFNFTQDNVSEVIQFVDRASGTFQGYSWDTAKPNLGG